MGKDTFRGATSVASSARYRLNRLRSGRNSVPAGGLARSPMISMKYGMSIMWNSFRMALTILSTLDLTNGTRNPMHSMRSGRSGIPTSSSTLRTMSGLWVGLESVSTSSIPRNPLSSTRPMPSLVPAISGTKNPKSSRRIIQNVVLAPSNRNLMKFAIPMNDGRKRCSV